MEVVYMSKILNLVMCLILLLGGAFVGYKLNNITVVTNEKKISAGVIKNDILGVQELAVGTYSYEAIGSIDDKTEIFGQTVPMTGKKLLIIFNGQIKYGYDLSALKEHDIIISDKKVAFKLPQAKILSNEIDTSSAQIVLADGSLFNGIKPEDTIAAANKVKMQTSERALKSTTLKKTAEENVKRVLQLIVGSYNKDVTVEIITQ